MKRLFLFLLSVGLLFAAVPQSIPGTGLKLLETETELGEEMGYYATDDQVTVAVLAQQSMSSSEWSDIESQYISGGLASRTDSGVKYYYTCEETDGEMQCFSDMYNNGMYYAIDVNVLDGTESETVDTVINIGREAMKTGGAATPTPSSGGCLPAAILLLLVSIVVFRG